MITRGKITLHWWPAVVVMVSACGGGGEAAPDMKSGTVVVAQAANEVSVMTLHPGVFHHEVVSNGRVGARRYADLYFGSAETVAQVHVKNGDAVHTGQKLAELDTFRLERKRRQAEVSLKQSELELQNVLIGQGYVPAEREAIPEPVMELAMVKSGYAQNKTQYELAVCELEHAVLTAPFDGVVANLNGKAYNRATTSGAFCRVIDNRTMEVEFSIIESELLVLKTGNPVEVTPFAEPESHYTGRICEINPLVDSRGMVKVKAAIDGSPRLFEGMNVRVNVRYDASGQWVIPKTAVVMRSGKPVVFTVKEGQAQWNYVELGMENMTEYTVGGLSEGDRVIVSGNLNLAHETEVVIVDER